MTTKIEAPKHGKKVSGIFEGPSWCPQWADFNEKRQREMLAKVGEGSHCEQAVKGKLTSFRAWGREVYGLECETAKGKSVFHVPEHTALYNALASVKMGAECYVAVTGRANKAKPGQQAAILYDVIPYDETDILPAPRKDALAIVRREDVEFPPTDD